MLTRHIKAAPVGAARRYTLLLLRLMARPLMRLQHLWLVLLVACCYFPKSCSCRHLTVLLCPLQGRHHCASVMIAAATHWLYLSPLALRLWRSGQLKMLLLQQLPGQWGQVLIPVSAFDACCD